MLGAVVLKRDGKPIPAPYPFTMYQGLLFANIVSQWPPHRRIKRSLEIVDVMLSELEKKEELISFCLHPHFEDLRSFVWFHYHEPEKGRFAIELRYTGRLALSRSFDSGYSFDSLRQSRKYEFRHAQSHGFVVESTNDIGTLDHLHRLTFERQGLQRTVEEERLLCAVARAALMGGFGEILIARDPQGSAVSATLFIYDRNSGYYLFGANDPSFRQSGASTLLLLENIRRCFQRGPGIVDFVGINSPNRGDYKTSFNAVPVPYFVVTWKKPE